MTRPPAFVPARHTYGLGMTVEEARQILATGQGSQELLQEAWTVYYGQRIAQEPEQGPGDYLSVEQIAEQSTLRPEQVEQLLQQGFTPNQILHAYGYAYAGDQEADSLIDQATMLRRQLEQIRFYEAEQCDPLDTPCVIRNHARQQANMAAQAEANRLQNLATCLENAARNTGSVRAQMLAQCAQYQTPVPIPPAPGTPTISFAERQSRYEEAARQAEEFARFQAEARARELQQQRPTTYSPRVQLENASRPGQPLRVGDAFRVRVAGAQPGAAIEVEAYQDGRSLGRTRYGQADEQGNFTLTGTIGAEHAGHWREIWHIGSAQVTIEFDVEDAPQPDRTITDLRPQQPTLRDQPPAGGPSDLFASVPAWVWLVAAGAVVWRVLQR